MPYTGLINGIDFNKLVRDAVYLNVPQTIPAALELNTVVAQKNIKLVGTLNKVQLPQLHKDLSLFERAANQLGTVMGQKIGEHEAILDRLSCFLTGEQHSLPDDPHFTPFGKHWLRDEEMSDLCILQWVTLCSRAKCFLGNICRSRGVLHHL